MTIREQIEIALVAALSAGGTGSPAGLTVHRERTRPIEVDSLPAIMIYTAKELKPKPLAQVTYDAPLVERQFFLAAQIRAQGSATVPPDAALDPVLIWLFNVLRANERFGGLASSVEEDETDWASREGDTAVAAATVHFTIKYRTSRLDPTSKS